MNLEVVRRLVANARAGGRSVLLETEGLELLDAIGIDRPRHLFVRDSAEARSLQHTGLSGERVVVKVVSPAILHKSDVGGVAIVQNACAEVSAAIEDMEVRLADRGITGFLLLEFVQHDASLGGELLVGLRWTAEFGPIVTVGAGGITTELLARDLRTGRDAAIVSPHLPAGDLHARLQEVSAVHLATKAFRGQPARTTVESVAAVALHLGELARAVMPDGIAECEINPLAVTASGLVALDVLVTLSGELASPAPPRPLHKIGRLLQPRSAAIIGVSEQLNPGRIILNNLLRDGFDPAKIAVVKPGIAEIAGCRCYPDVASIPGRVDMFVLAVGAAQVPQVLRDIVTSEKAESVIVIPGGLEEKAGTEDIVRRMREALVDSRAAAWEGPIVNGGNCLGIRSRPGRYDTMFIPEYKMPRTDGPVSPVAVISQSGAFGISRASRFGRINPRYVITVGNQMDVTIGDYVSYLANDTSLEVFAVYVEGFKPLDGLRFLEAAWKIVASGRRVILYRAGRTAEGARATASHTASIAGDYRVTRAMCEQAGVILAESLADFDDLVSVCALLRDCDPPGVHLGAMSNAGFESVAIADALQNGLQLVPFSDATRERIRRVLVQARIDTLVDVHNPLDITPMAGDGAFAEIASLVLADEQVDAAVVGCVPMTGALATLPAGEEHREDLAAVQSIVPRLGALRRQSRLPWVAVVDAGGLYDAMSAALERESIPTFRTADRAVRVLSLLAHHKVHRAQGAAEDGDPTTAPPVHRSGDVA